MEPDFGVTTARLGSTTYVVSVRGEADAYAASHLERELEDVLQRGSRSVIVDLAEVGFIDSTALGVLLRFQARFRALGGDLVLVSDDRRVRRTLEITGFDRIFRVERRLGDAVGEAYADSLPATEPA